MDYNDYDPDSLRGCLHDTMTLVVVILGVAVVVVILWNTIGLAFSAWLY